VTDAESVAGVTALQDYVEAINWFEGDMLSQEVYQAGVTDTVVAADASSDQSAAGRQAAGASALMAAIQAAGYGQYVTSAECAAGAAAVLAAVARVRADAAGSC